MNVDLLIKDNKALREEKQRYKEMWFTANNALAKYISIEKKVGGPIDVLIRVLKQSGCNCGVYFDTVDTDGIERKGMYRFTLNYDSFNEKVFLNTGWNGKTYLSDHKITWWLKEEREE